MPDIVNALQSGNLNLWLFIPTAILLGALHGLEPGHSKTMMAAFIIAIRGTIAQAVLLGLAAAISHSLIIWLLAALALHFGSRWNAENVEPYLQIGSAFCILALAAWMFLRTRRDLREAHDHSHEHHHDDHEHEHGRGVTCVLDTGHEKIELSVFEDGVPPVFRLKPAAGGTLPAESNVAVETLRSDGARQEFAFVARDGFLESREEIPEPHEFDLVLTVSTDGERRTARTKVHEDGHEHGSASEFQDAH
jgi:nickel/cobalt exporter